MENLYDSLGNKLYVNDWVEITWIDFSFQTNVETGKITNVMGGQLRILHDNNDDSYWSVPCKPHVRIVKLYLEECDGSL